jgi:hypothetical protein
VRKSLSGRGGARARLTHFEVRRGGALRVRISIADDAIAEAGDELGALVRKVAPCTVAHGVVAPEPVVTGRGAIAVVSSAPPSDFVVSPEHANDDDSYHASLRERLSELMGSLCDASLADALEIARQESARRAGGQN